MTLIRIQKKINDNTEVTVAMKLETSGKISEILETEVKKLGDRLDTGMGGGGCEVSKITI